MRFDSIKRLIEFLQGLVVMGYVVPFFDYQQDLIKHGFDKHIHCYSWNMVVTNTGIMLVTYDKSKSYTIDITKGLV